MKDRLTLLRKEAHAKKLRKDGMPGSEKMPTPRQRVIAEYGFTDRSWKNWKTEASVSAWGRTATDPDRFWEQQAPWKFAKNAPARSPEEEDKLRELWREWHRGGCSGPRPEPIGATLPRLSVAVVWRTGSA